MLFARQPAIKCCVVTWSVRFLCVASSHALFYFIKILSGGGKDMDRGSLVASLQNFRQSLSRQRKLEASLDDLRKLEEEYREGSKKPIRKECDVAPEKAGDKDTNLAKYDEKHKPKNIKNFMGSALHYVLMIVSAILSTVLMMMHWGASTAFIIMFVIDMILALVIAVIASYFAVGLIGVIVDSIITPINKNRGKRYLKKHKAARLREYNKDLENQYEKQLNYANEMSLKRAAALPVIEKQERELAEVNRVIAEYDILPEKYKYFDAVDRITEYIRDMRADSIKEAINMYVFERRERSREDIRQFEEERRLEEMRTAQQEMMYEARRRSEKLQNAQQELIDEERRRRKAAEETRDTMKDIKNKLDN